MGSLGLGKHGPVRLDNAHVDFVRQKQNPPLEGVPAAVVVEPDVVYAVAVVVVAAAAAAVLIVAGITGQVAVDPVAPSIQSAVPVLAGYVVSVECTSVVQYCSPAWCA